jgi:8-oxo-dGTP pyrophosphatase MutT (NUDIX family)
VILTRELVVQRLALERTRGVRGDRRRSNEDAQEVAYREQDRNPYVRGDHPLKPAAVLVPLVDRGTDGLMVLLTRRTDHLSNHGGQISFPGGRCDPGDPDCVATALRETEEEVGIARRHITIVGELDDYIVGTGYLVRPVVGLVQPPFELKPHDHEVAEIFEAPLDFIADPANLQRHSRTADGIKRDHFAIPWGEYYIWGATAGMLRNLSELLWLPESVG